MSVPDLQIKTRVRSVLSRHWIDLTRIGFDCCKGSVRFRGELSHVEGHRTDGSRSALLEVIEAEVKRIPGVRSVYLMGVTVSSAAVTSRQGKSADESNAHEVSASDLRIRSRVRSVLSKHRIDLTKVDFDCCKGTIRFRGELCPGEDHRSERTDISLVEVLEAELKRIPGVRKVYFLGVKVESTANTTQREKSHGLTLIRTPEKGDSPGDVL